MLQIQSMPTTRQHRNQSTCGFFGQNKVRAQSLQNLLHTSGIGYRKCGEKRLQANQNTVLNNCDLRFYGE